MAGYLPRSEAELFRARPGSNRAGAFPPSALLGQEKIVYETRPGLTALHPALFWSSLAWAIFFALVVAAGVGQGLNAALAAALVIILLIGFAPLLVSVVLPYRTSYALTDQRVVSRSGDTFDSVPMARVQAVRLGRRSSTLLFELAPDPSDSRHRRPGSSQLLLEWKGVPGAPGVATYANSAVKFYQIAQRQKQLRDAIVSTSMEDRIVCEYCGAMVPVASLEPDNPRCPRCSAPVLVAPLGM